MLREPRGKIYVPAKNGTSFVTVESDGRPVTTTFGPVKTELILLLNRALEEDAQLEPAERGWRTPEQLAALLDYPPEEPSLRRAISIVNRAFREAAEKANSPLASTRLVSTQRQVGIRLSWPLQVVDPPDVSLGCR